MGRKGVRSQPSDSRGEKRVEARRWASYVGEGDKKGRGGGDLGEAKKRKCLK